MNTIEEKYRKLNKIRYLPPFEEFEKRLRFWNGAKILLTDFGYRYKTCIWTKDYPQLIQDDNAFSWNYHSIYL